MSDPLPLGKKMQLLREKKQARHVTRMRNNSVLFVALMLILFGSVVRLFDNQATAHAFAETSQETSFSVKSPLFEQSSEIFAEQDDSKESLKLFEQKIYDLVGETPIKEMVPFISQRDQKVAAFLIGIAKKESSLGLASPSKDGKTCYNYWGYKGAGGRGVGMGYACFASAEEAVDVVGDRIEVLIGKNRSTPSKMVDTWKCGTSCKGDPGAPGWVSTVALYFNKIVDQNS